MEKRKLNVKKRIIMLSVLIMITALIAVMANAAGDSGLVKFLFNGKEYSGGIYDYIDEDGFRHVGYEVELPTYEENYAIIFDADAPSGENIRAITEETDPEFFEKLGLYHEAFSKGPADPEDFGLLLKDNELCTYRIGTLTNGSCGSFGGEFMRVGAAADKPSGIGEINDDKKSGVFYDWDFENETYFETKICRDGIFYYVGN